jgi:hypothetical protein
VVCDPEVDSEEAHLRFELVKSKLTGAVLTSHPEKAKPVFPDWTETFAD